MFILCFVVFADAIGFGIILPLLPVFAIKFDLSSLQLALLFSSFAFAQLLTAPFLGAISDKFGRKKIIVICLLALSGSYFMLSIAQTFLQAIVARILAGCFTGNVSVVLASASDLSTEKNRAKYLGYIGAASGIGFVLGPIIGGFLAGNNNDAVDFKIVFGFAAVFSFIATLLAAIFLKETLVKSKNYNFNFTTKMKRTLKLIVFNKSVMFLIYLSIIMWFCFSAIYVFLTTWTAQRLALGAFDISIVGTFFALFTAIVQIVSPRFITGGKAILLGFQLCAFAMLLMLTKPYIITLIIIIILLASGLGLLFTNINSSLSFFGRNNQLGFVFGLSQSASNIGQALGPVVIGYIYSSSSPFYAWLILGLTFFIASFITVQYMFDAKKYIDKKITK